MQQPTENSLSSFRLPRPASWISHWLVTTLLVGGGVAAVVIVAAVVPVPLFAPESLTISTSGYVTYDPILTLSYPGTYHFSWTSNVGTDVYLVVMVSPTYNPLGVQVFSGHGPRGSGTISISPNDHYTFEAVGATAGSSVSVFGIFDYTAPLVAPFIDPP